MTDYVCTSCHRDCVRFDLSDEDFDRLQGCYCPFADCYTDWCDTGAGLVEWPEGSGQWVERDSDDECEGNCEDCAIGFDVIQAEWNDTCFGLLKDIDAFVENRRAQKIGTEIRLGLRDDALFALLANGWSYVRIAELFGVDTEIVIDAVENMVEDGRIIDLLVHPDDGIDEAFSKVLNRYDGGECDD